MGDDDAFDARRQPWREGPDSVDGWLALSDDELLYRIEAIQPSDATDPILMEVVRSGRHFFIRQEAAKKIKDHHLLKEQSGDRHIGQILVRSMTRADDIAYLEKIITETRHLEVRKAADAQLRLIRGQN